MTPLPLFADRNTGTNPNLWKFIALCVPVHAKNTGRLKPARAKPERKTLAKYGSL